MQEFRWDIMCKVSDSLGKELPSLVLTTSRALLPHGIRLSIGSLQYHWTHTGEVINQSLVGITGLIIKAWINSIQLLVDLSLGVSNRIKELLHLRRLPRDIELRHILGIGIRGSKPHVLSLIGQVDIDPTVLISRHLGISVSG